MSSDRGDIQTTPGHDSDAAVSLRGVSKCYHVYRRPADRLLQALSRWKRTYYTEFWALRSVSLDVNRGDAVAIIGRNGCGKSTLLQIIAGTLAPTEGSVRVRGRVSALLELGSGFNPEFTGRENVFLYASILGISRAETQARLPQIEAFADIGEFIDRPIKTYSSGMHARLAFSVAISVDPDILIVDEILAVGDIGFQAKCLSRLRELRDRGMTLLYVSHSPDAVKSVCQKALFLVDGQPMFYGAAERAVDQYLAHVRSRTNAEALQSQRDLGPPVAFRSAVAGSNRYGSGQVQIQGVELRTDAGEPARAFRFGDTITLEVTLQSHVAVNNLSVSFLIRDMTGVDLTGTTTFDERAALPRLEPGGSCTVRFRFRNFLRLGNFSISAAVNRVASRDYSDNVLFDQVDACAAFSVLPEPGRPVHYKFHTPVEIEVECPHHAAR